MEEREDRPISPQQQHLLLLKLDRREKKGESRPAALRRGPVDVLPTSIRFWGGAFAPTFFEWEKGKKGGLLKLGDATDLSKWASRNGLTMARLVRCVEANGGGKGKKGKGKSDLGLNSYPRRDVRSRALSWRSSNPGRRSSWLPNAHQLSCVGERGVGTGRRKGEREGRGDLGTCRARTRYRCGPSPYMWKKACCCEFCAELLSPLDVPEEREWKKKSHAAKEAMFVRGVGNFRPPSSPIQPLR